MVSSSVSFVGGLVACLLGSILICLGQVLVKLSIKRRELGGSDFSKPYWYGCVFFAVGSLLNFISFGYASSQALASIGGVQFVVNIFASNYFLNESVTWKHILATFILSMGVTVAVGNSSNSGTAAGLSTKDIIQLYDNINYRLLIVSLLAIAFLSEIVYRTCEIAHEKNTDDRSQLLRPLAFALTSTIIGTQAVVQSKSIALIFRHCVENGIYTELYSFPMYAFGSIFAMCVTIWLRRLHWALKSFDCLLIIPLMQSCYIISAVLQGSVFFQEFDDSSTAYFFLGILLILVGVYVLSSAYRDTTRPQEESPQTGDNSEESPNTKSEASVCLSPPHKCATNSKETCTFVPGPGYALSSPNQSAWYRINRVKNWTVVNEDLL